MKFKVGDKVKIKRYDAVDKHHGIADSYWGTNDVYAIHIVENEDSALPYFIKMVNNPDIFWWVSEMDIEYAKPNESNVGKIFDFSCTTWEVLDILRLNEDWYICKSLDGSTAMTFRADMVDDIIKNEAAKYSPGDIVAVKPMVFTAIKNDFYEAIRGVWIGTISSFEVKNGEVVYDVHFGDTGVKLEVLEEEIAGTFEAFSTDELINTFVTKDTEKERLRDRRDYFMYIIGNMEGNKKVIPLNYPKVCLHAKEYTFGNWKTVASYAKEKKLEFKKRG